MLWTNETRTQHNIWKNPAIAAQLRSELESSNDTALVGTVARHVVEDATMAALVNPTGLDFKAMRTLATELVTHAQALEPQNREWSDLMEGIQGLPAA